MQANRYNRYNRAITMCALTPTKHVQTEGSCARAHLGRLAPAALPRAGVTATALTSLSIAPGGGEWRAAGNS